MLIIFIAKTLLIYSSSVSRWHDSLRAYTLLAVNHSLKLKPVLSKMVIYGHHGCQYRLFKAFRLII